MRAIIKEKMSLLILLPLFAVCILLPHGENCSAADGVKLDAVVYAWKEKAETYYYDSRYLLYGGTESVSLGASEGNFAGSITCGGKKYYFDDSSCLYDANGTKLYEWFDLVINPLYDNITNSNYASERASMTDYELKREHYHQWIKYVQAKQGWIAGLQNYSGAGETMCNSISSNTDVDGTNLYYVQTYTDIWQKYIDERIQTVSANGYSFADALADRTNRAGYLISFLNQDGVFYAFKTGVVNYNTDMDEMGFKVSELNCSYTEYITFTVEDLYNYIIAKQPKTLSCAPKYTKAYGSKPFLLDVKDASGAVRFSSSNSKIARVSSEGEVTVLNTGYARITITAENGTVASDIYIVPKKSKLSGLRSAASKTVAVKWKQDKRATGYQIGYSANSKFKNAKYRILKKSKTVSCKIKNLKPKKYYYIKVRAYKTIKGTKRYGAWSQVKKIKVK